MPESTAATRALNRPLHIAVEAHDLARDERGIGTYARALLRRFVRRDDLRLTLLVRRPLPRWGSAALRAALGLSPAARLSVMNRIPHDADVVWHPWNGTFFGGSARAAATIHDLVPFALPATNRKRRASQQEPFLRTARTAGAIVCDSQFTAGEVQKYLAVERARLHVVPLGVDPDFAPGDLALLPPGLRGRRYVLYVGAHDQHKNVMTLVAAHRAAFASDDVALVFTRRNELVPEALVYEGVDIPTLVALYRGAWVVAVPSVYEGFGLPLLEALACGAPALASRAAALPEVGGTVSAYVDAPRDIAAWQHALSAFSADSGRRNAMAQAGPPHAAAFTWESCAQRTLDVLRATAAV